VTAPSADLVVAPRLEEPHRERVNLVWCASLELAWARLCELSGGEVRLSGGAPAEAVAVVGALNRGASLPAIAAERCLARAGTASPRFYDELREEARRRFGVDDPVLGAPPMAPDMLVAYALLVVRAAFAAPFARASWPLHFRDGFVHSFGLWWEGDGEQWKRRASQVLVHQPCYSEEEVAALGEAELDRLYEEFVVELRPEGDRDRILVALVPPAATLADTVASILARVSERAEKHPHGRLDPRERLEVPRIGLDVTRRFDELAGLRLQVPPPMNGALGEVMQHVLFRLDEGGATLESSALAGGLALPPRHLVCDRPFAVILQERGVARPYFVLWVETRGVLEPAPDPTATT
jgi:hypothetical protein